MGVKPWYVEVHVLAEDTNCTLAIIKAAMYMSLKCKTVAQLL